MEMTDELEGVGHTAADRERGGGRAGRHSTQPPQRPSRRLKTFTALEAGSHWTVITKSHNKENFK